MRAIPVVLCRGLQVRVLSTDPKPWKTQTLALGLTAGQTVARAHAINGEQSRAMITQEVTVIHGFLTSMANDGE
jgi:hypothetical protein